MIPLVALDFVLRVVRIGVMDVAFVIRILGVNQHDVTGGPTDFELSPHAITDLKRFCNDASREAYFRESTSALVGLKIDRQQAKRCPRRDMRRGL